MADTTLARPEVTSVFVLDDHELIRRGLTELISVHADLDVVGTASTAREALPRLLACRPDVALLDARLPDGSGIDVCREVKAALPDTRVIILTSFNDDDLVLGAIMAGADGFVLKEVRGDALAGAIKHVAAGGSLIDPEVTASVLHRIRHGDDADDELAGLTDRELAVLELITEGRSNREIADTLYLSEKTVKNYVSRLLAKLRMQRRAQIAAFGATHLARPTALSERSVSG